MSHAVRVIEAQQRFRCQIADIPSSARLALAGAVRELARAWHRVEADAGLTLDELADLLEPSLPPPALRPPLAKASPSGPAGPLPPDYEGDEYLRDHQHRFRRP